MARRVLLVGGLVLALTCALWQEKALYRVEAVDFAVRQQEEPGWTGRRQVSLKDYIESRTKGRLLEKSGPAWLDLYREVEGGGPDRFFLPSWKPLYELAGAFEGTFTYLALNGEGPTRYLAVTVWRPGDFPAAPASLRYPLRRLAWLVLLVGVLGYALLPWPRPDPNVVAYSRSRTGLLPDLFVGMLLVGMFYALPWLVVPNEAHVSHPLLVEGGWIILTVVMWTMALFGVAIYGTAAWYEALCIHVGGDHLVIESLRSAERIEFADIEGVHLGVREPPKALVRVGLLVSLLNWRALGPTLIMAGRRDRVVDIVLRNGRRRRLGLMGAHHLDRLVAALGQAGVAVDPELVRASMQPKSAE